MYQVVLTHTYLFWVKFHPSRTFLPNKLERERKNRHPFLPTAKLHPLNTLTRGSPPMYWLGISRWCPGPLYMLHFVWICFFLAFTLFLLPLYCLVLLLVLIDVILYDVKDAWAFGLIFPSLHPFLGWVSLRWKPSSSCWAHAFFFMAMGLFSH